jgi:hypothetical protein
MVGVKHFQAKVWGFSAIFGNFYMLRPARFALL